MAPLGWPNMADIVALPFATSTVVAGFASAAQRIGDVVGMISGMAEIDAYRAAHAARRLPVRVWGCLAGNPEGETRPYTSRW